MDVVVIAGAFLAGMVCLMFLVGGNSSGRWWG